MPSSTARTQGVVPPQTARAAAAATPLTRAQALAQALGVHRGAPGKTGANEDDDPGGKDTKKAKDDSDAKDGDAPDDEQVTKGQAGSAGDFTTMPGSLSDPYDSNADKGDTPAANDTGAPKTPSGI